MSIVQESLLASSTTVWLLKALAFHTIKKPRRGIDWTSHQDVSGDTDRWLSVLKKALFGGDNIKTYNLLQYFCKISALKKKKKEPTFVLIDETMHWVMKIERCSLSWFNL